MNSHRRAAPLFMLALAIVAFVFWFVRRNRGGDGGSKSVIDKGVPVASTSLPPKQTTVVFDSPVPESIAQSQPPSVVTNVQLTPEEREAMLTVARSLHQEWKLINLRIGLLPRAQWEAEAAKFRDQNLLALQSLKEVFGEELPLQHPAELDPSAPPYPAAERSRSLASQKDPVFEARKRQIEEFKTARAALADERLALLKTVSDKTQDEMHQALSKWEEANARRLQHHRQLAIDLGQLPFDSISTSAPH